MKIPVSATLPPPPAAPNWVELADLKVQQQLADIAQQMMWLTLGQLILAVAGTVALIITLRESRRATATAMKALHVQQSAERAILTVSDAFAGAFIPAPQRPGSIALEINTTNDAAHVFAGVRVKNQGASIALIQRYAIKMVFDEAPTRPVYPKEARSELHRPLEIGEEFRIRAPDHNLDDARVDVLSRDGLRMWFFGFVDYLDVFGDPHILRFAYFLERKKGRGDPVQYGGELFWKAD